VIERTITLAGERLAVLNGRGGLELIENLEAGCAGMIVAPDTADHQQRVFELLRTGREEEARALYARILPAIVFAMQSLDTLVCYGKRIAAWRLDTLSLISSIADGGGPMNSTPSAVTARAKSAFSLKKP
jgi:4-hydroxy-tetrahydrodipicolinate synthase